MSVTRTGRVPTLLGVLLLAGGAWAPPAEAKDTLTVLSVTPSSGPVPIVPGGNAATPASLTPSNHIVARVVFPNAASFGAVNLIQIGATSIPQTAPAGQQLPRAIVKPFQKTAVSGRGPIRHDVEFGYTCTPTSVHQTTLTSINIVGASELGFPPLYEIWGSTPVHLVITCPEVVSPKPPVRVAKP